jgi:hypothetical protein
MGGGTVIRLLGIDAGHYCGYRRYGSLHTLVRHSRIGTAVRCGRAKWRPQPAFLTGRFAASGKLMSVLKI